MNIEGIDIKDIEFGEPIEEKEPSYRDGYIRGIYRSRNIIDNQQKEIERLNNIINELEKWLVESIEKHTEDYLDWKYDRNVYLAGSKKLQNVLDKLQELKGDGSNE